MTIASAGSVGTSQAKATGSSLAITTSATIPAGNLAIVAYATDNLDTSDGETSVVTAVTDSAGNTWTKIAEYTNTSGGVVGDGVLVAIFYTVAASQLTSGQTITITQGSDTNGRAGSVWQFTIDAAAVEVADYEANGGESSTIPDISLSGLASAEYLLFHGLGVEGPGTMTYTEDADYTSISGDGTTGGGGATNISIRGGFRIATRTDDTVSTSIGNNTTTAHILAAIAEAAGGDIVEGAATLAGQGAVSAAGQRVAQGAATLNGAGVLAATAQRVAQATATLTGQGATQFAGRVIAQATAALAGSGAVQAAGQRLAQGVALLAGNATTQATGQLIAQAVATLTGEATLTATAQGVVIVTAEAFLAAQATLQATGRRVAQGAAVLAAQGTFQAAGQRLVQAAATLAGNGTIQAAGQRVAGAAATLAGQATLQAAGRMIGRARATLSGQATLVATAVVSGPVALVSLVLRSRTFGLAARGRTFALVAAGRSFVSIAGDRATRLVTSTREFVLSLKERD